MEPLPLSTTDRERMFQARNFIKNKQYAEARPLLEQVDHPKAREWLAKIDEIELDDAFEVNVSSLPSPSLSTQTIWDRSTNPFLLLQGAVACMVRHKWILKSQTDNRALLEKKQNPSVWVSAILIALLALLGSLIVCALIAAAPIESVAFRLDEKGRLYVTTKDGVFSIENLGHAENVAKSVSSASGADYAAAIILGLVMSAVYYALYAFIQIGRG